MTDDGHTGGTRPARVGWRVGAIQVAAAFAWCAAIAGFVVYLVSLDSFMDAYGGVGTGIVLLMWLTLLSLLHHATPSLRLRAVGSAAPPPPPRPPGNRRSPSRSIWWWRRPQRFATRPRRAG